MARYNPLNLQMGNRAEINRRLLIAILIFTACAAFISGWYIERRRIQSAPVPRHSMGNAQSAQPVFSCDNAPDDLWHTVRTFDYQPVKTLYIVVWQVCLADIEGRRVRVMDANF